MAYKQLGLHMPPWKPFKIQVLENAKTNLTPFNVKKEKKLSASQNHLAPRRKEGASCVHSNLRLYQRKCVLFLFPHFNACRWNWRRLFGPLPVPASASLAQPVAAVWTWTAREPSSRWNQAWKTRPQNSKVRLRTVAKIPMANRGGRRGHRRCQTVLIWGQVGACSLDFDTLTACGYIALIKSVKLLFVPLRLFVPAFECVFVCVC